MAGHSKWANIQHRKRAQDSKRGKVFTRLIREITIAARMGGEDLASNPRLRAGVDAAKAANMGGDTIARAIKRGAGGLEGQNVEDVIYEGYGPGGVAVMVFCMTDNRNRTVAEVRHAFTKCGGNLGTDGSVGYLFTKLGQFMFSNEYSEDQIMEAALEAGADDVAVEDDGTIMVSTQPLEFQQVSEALQARNLKAESAEVTMVPSTWVDVEEVDAEKLLKLYDMLDNLDDVQSVCWNASIADELLEKFGS